MMSALSRIAQSAEGQGESKGQWAVVPFDCTFLTLGGETFETMALVYHSLDGIIGTFVREKVAI